MKIALIVFGMLFATTSKAQIFFRNYIDIRYEGPTNKAIQPLIFYCDRKYESMKDTMDTIVLCQTVLTNERSYNILIGLIAKFSLLKDELDEKNRSQALFVMSIYTDSTLTSHCYFYGKAKGTKIIKNMVNALKSKKCDKRMVFELNDFIDDFVLIPKYLH